MQKFLTDVHNHSTHSFDGVDKLSDMLAAGECGSLVIVYGIMSDKDFHSIAHLLPAEAHYVFTSAPGPRALPAEALAQKYADYCAEEGITCAPYQVEQDPSKAMKMALETSSDMNEPLIYVGGSTYVVAEIIRWFKEK
jgi:dihydrofolate synthase/folylpolyglutamate synthase